eukprot:m.38734 g.38734  ORF g.38734 m.38734 type:complete len:139 (+) comp16539_c1_seq2:548-964(+)
MCPAKVCQHLLQVLWAQVCAMVWLLPSCLSTMQGVFVCWCEVGCFFPSLLTFPPLFFLVFSPLNYLTPTHASPLQQQTYYYLKKVKKGEFSGISDLLNHVQTKKPNTFSSIKYLLDNTTFEKTNPTTPVKVRRRRRTD